MFTNLMLACLSLTTTTSQPPADETTKIMLDFRLVEADIDDRWFEPDDNEEDANIALQSDGSISLRGRALAHVGGDLLAYFTVDPEGTIGIGSWRCSASPSTPTDETGPFSIIAVPRITVMDQQEAHIRLGQAVEYLEPTQEAGVFRVTTDDSLTEGVTISVTPRLMESGSILLEPMTIEIGEVVGRSAVEGIEILRVGKPDIETTQYEMGVLVREGRTVVVPLSYRDFSDRPLLLLVRPTVVLSGSGEESRGYGISRTTPNEGGRGRVSKPKLIDSGRTRH